jgi:hypothetical protein
MLCFFVTRASDLCVLRTHLLLAYPVRFTLAPFASLTLRTFYWFSLCFTLAPIASLTCAFYARTYYWFSLCVFEARTYH